MQWIHSAAFFSFSFLSYNKLYHLLLNYIDVNCYKNVSFILRFYYKIFGGTMKIKEIIVVEGKDDTTAIQQAVNADTIETNGSAINEETIEKIKLASETRGVIVLTDPDYPGQKIRHTISERVPGCKHAFIPKEEALHKRGKGVGVEHASPESIRRALKDAQLVQEVSQENVTNEDLITAGLVGGNGAKVRREKLGKLLKIGYTNGKQLHKRLMVFEISKQAFAEAIEVIRKEEEDV
jgi:ribonuclease M5